MTTTRLLGRATLALLLAGGATSCGSTEPSVELVAESDAGRPLAALDISVVPYDAERLLDSLARVAEAPRPEFPDLEAAFAGFERPDLARLDRVGSGWRATRDSVQHLADSLTLIGGNAPGYAGAYARLAALYRRLAQRAAEREDAFEAQVGEHRELALRAAAAADSLRRWEHAAFADLPALAESTRVRTGRVEHHLTTDEHGTARVSLAPGSWWAVARWPDPDNPFREYVWSVPFVAGRLGPRRVSLHLDLAEPRWRH